MQISGAVGAISDYARSVALRQSSIDDAQVELAALAEAWEPLRARVVSSREEYDHSQHYDVLLSDADGTYTVSFSPADHLPWPLRGIHRSSEGDLLRVNGTTLGIQQAVACLDFIWERDDLLAHLVNVCLVEEELAIRGPFPVSGTELQERLDDFRRSRSLFTVAETKEWMAQRGLSHRQLERRLADALRVELLVEQAVGSTVADYLEAHEAELGLIPLMTASSRSQEDLEELKCLPADAATWHAWALMPGGDARAVQSCRVSTLDAPPPLAILASHEVAIGSISQIFSQDGVHTLGCKIGSTQPIELGPDLTTRIRDRLFADWLRQRRKSADIEWYWGSQTSPPSRDDPRDFPASRTAESHPQAAAAYGC